MSRLRNRAISLMALAAMTSGCAQVGAAKVGIRPIEADVVFGVKEKTPPAAPAGFASPSEDVAAAPIESAPSASAAPRSPKTAVTRPATSEELGFSSDEAPPPPKPKPLPTPLPPPPECRTAGINDFPADESTTFVTTQRPAVGDYRFKKEGQNTPAGAPFPEEITGFETRRVADLVERSPKPSEGFVDYTWQTSQVDPLKASVTIKTTYQMQRLDGQLAPAAQGQRTGERGLTVARIERTEKLADGKVRSSSFSPAPRVLLLPVPVVVNEAFNSTGVDPTTLDRFQVQGKVIGKQQVDACGERIDGWRVESTQTFNTEARKVNYVVAMGLGGLIVLEELDVSNSATKLKATYTQAQVKPTAVRS